MLPTEKTGLMQKGPGSAATDGICSSCSTRLITDGGERLCPSCGLVAESGLLETTIEQGGIAPSLKGMQSAENPRITSIWRDKKLAQRMNGLPGIRYPDRRTRTVVRSFAEFQPAIELVCQAMSWPTVVRDRAGVIRAQMFRAGLGRGRTTEITATVATAIAARELGLVFSLRSLSKKTGQRWSKLARLQRGAVRKLHYRWTSPRAEDFIRKAALECSIPAENRDEAIEAVQEIGRWNETPKTLAVSLAAASTWWFWGRDHQVSQARIAEVFGTTEVSIRTAVKIYFKPETGL